MHVLFWLAVVAVTFGVVALAYVAGLKAGEAEARDEYHRALDWLADQYDDGHRRLHEP